VKPSRLAAFLGRHRRVSLDTSVFIYELDATPGYRELVGPVFRWIEAPRGAAVTSTMTMLELLVQPYRVGDLDRVNRFYASLSTYPNLDWVPHTLAIADQAARLRAMHRLQTPDAIQAATALAADAAGMITNDAAFRRVPELDVLLLDELL
jgi:predicted nucleic acid-binding protein